MLGSPYVIESAQQLSCLASAVRQDLVDYVAAAGPCTIADAARALGRTADGLYYHVSKLLDVGLLVRVGGPEQPAVLDGPGRPIKAIYPRQSGPAQRALVRAVGAMLRSSAGRFESALGPDAVTEGPFRDLHAARASGWLTQDELAELNRLTQRVLELVRSHGGSPPAGSRLHEVTLVHSVLPTPEDS